MKFSIGTNARDADASRRSAKKEGESDGAVNYPPKSPDGKPSPDYYGRAQQSEANTTDGITKGTHFGTQRVEDDERLGKFRPETGRHTTLAKDGRLAHEEALANERGFDKRLPLSAKAAFWPKEVVYGLLALLALASGAAVTAALLSVTTDQTLLTYIIGGGVALGTIVVGASLGTLLRRRDLDSVQKGRYASSGLYTTGVLVAGLLGMVAFGVAVASLRHDASQADAARRATATQFQVFIPGRTSSAASAPAGGVQGVGWFTWGLLEYGLAAAAVGIEFQRSDVRVEHLERLQDASRMTHTAWEKALLLLAQAIGNHETAFLARADRDLAVIYVGDAQRSYGDVLSYTQRHGNLAMRGQGGADPFEELTPHEPFALDSRFDSSPGTDVRPLAAGGEVDEAALARLIANDRDLSLLHAAYAELSNAPERPARFEDDPYLPGADLALDPAAQALADAQVASGDSSEAASTTAPATGRRDRLIDINEPAPDTVPGDLIGPNPNGQS